MKVTCASVECKYNGKNYQCTKNHINLSSHSIMTYWDGRQEFWKCKNYEPSTAYQEMLQEIANVFGGDVNEDTP